MNPQLASTNLYSIYQQTLSTREREVLHLLEIDGLDYQTAAGRIGLRREEIAELAFLARYKLLERMGRTLGEIT